MRMSRKVGLRVVLTAKSFKSEKEKKILSKEDMSKYQLEVYCSALGDGEFGNDIPYVNRVKETAGALVAALKGMRGELSKKRMLLIGSNVRNGVEFVHYHLAQPEHCTFFLAVLWRG